MSIILNSTWRERAILNALVLINSIMPLRVSMKLNYWFGAYMARNQAHAFARDMFSMIKKSKSHE